MVDIATLQQEKQISLSTLGVASRKLISGATIDDRECACAGVEATAFQKFCIFVFLVCLFF